MSNPNNTLWKGTDQESPTSTAIKFIYKLKEGYVKWGVKTRICLVHTPGWILTLIILMSSEVSNKALVYTKVCQVPLGYF